MLAPNRRWYLALVVALCACTASACTNHNAQLQTSLTVLNAARDGFTAWDDDHQHLIVTQATSLDQGKADLDAYRKKREPVIRAFELAYKTLATAALAPETDNLLLLVADLADLKTAVEALGASWPKGSP
jgi:hypothetical protein